MRRLTLQPKLALKSNASTLKSVLGSLDMHSGVIFDAIVGSMEIKTYHDKAFDYSIARWGSCLAFTLLTGETR